MQEHIAAWELLAQFALTYSLRVLLGPQSDNSAAEPVSTKGLSMNPGMASVLGAYFQFMRRHHIYSKIVHIPGLLNTLADALSRFETHSLPADDQILIPWRSWFSRSSIFTSASNKSCRWPRSLRCESGCEKLPFFSLHFDSSISCGMLFSGWSISRSNFGVYNMSHGV